MKDVKPILLTGSHRSGSSWVGRLLAEAPGVGLLYEPFNLEPHIRRRNGCKVRFPYWYTYVCEENQDQYLKGLSETLAFHYHFAAQCDSVSSLKDMGRLLRDFTYITSCRLARRRPLMKDPIAALSAEWLANSFDMQVIILVRHPAAFVGSLLIRNWHHPFHHFLEQPLLMERYLNKYRGELEDIVRSSRDIVDQGALLWTMLYDVLSTYIDRNPDWIVVRHEDLSMQPLEGFRKLYTALGLAYSGESEKLIAAHSLDPRPVKRGLPKAFQRDSRANTTTWKVRLTPADVIRVRKRVEPVAVRYYEDEDWD